MFLNKTKSYYALHLLFALYLLIDPTSWCIVLGLIICNDQKLNFLKSILLVFIIVFIVVMGTESFAS